jgi:hypothetical protein
MPASVNDRDKGISGWLVHPANRVDLDESVNTEASATS